jgi:uncharacterized protein (TIGR03437 family)
MTPLALVTPWTAFGQSYTISTFAGTGKAGYSGDNGSASSAQLGYPYGVAVDSAGNLYIADMGTQSIRKVSDGVITTVAGNGTAGFAGDGFSALGAELYYPTSVAVDSAGDLYIADAGNNRVRKVSGGVITTVAGGGATGFSGDNGPATSALLDLVVTGFYSDYVGGVAVDSSGNLYIADTGNGRVRKVSNGIITTVAGGGTEVGDNISPLTAKLDPVGIAVDSAGSLYIADADSGNVRKVANGIITSVAVGVISPFLSPSSPIADFVGGGLSVDSAGNVYIVDAGHNLVRKLSGETTTIIAGGGSSLGDGGPATDAEFEFLAATSGGGIAVDSLGNVYVGDTGHNRIRILTPGTTINAGGVVPLDSTVNTIQPGEWVSVYGTNLASSPLTWTGNFPTSLGGTSVTIDGKLAYLSYVSPGQINLQAPDDAATGSVPVVVTSPSGMAISTVTLAPFGPSFLLLDSKHAAGIIPRSNGSGAYGAGTYDILGPNGYSLGYQTVAAKAGDIVELFAVGLGPTSPAVPAGQVFSGAAPTTNPVSLVINGANVIPSFAGLSGAGLYQINLTVPVGLGTGDVPLVAAVGGVQTPPDVVIPLQ